MPKYFTKTRHYNPRGKYSRNPRRRPTRPIFRIPRNQQFGDQLGGWIKNKTPLNDLVAKDGFFCKAQTLTQNSPTANWMIAFQLDQGVTDFGNYILPELDVNLQNALKAVYQEYRIDAVTVIITQGSRDTTTLSQIYLAPCKQQPLEDSNMLFDPRAMAGCTWKPLTAANDQIRLRIKRPVTTQNVARLNDNTGGSIGVIAGAKNQYMMMNNTGIQATHWGMALRIEQAGNSGSYVVQCHYELSLKRPKFALPESALRSLEGEPSSTSSKEEDIPTEHGQAEELHRPSDKESPTGHRGLETI